MINTRQKVKRIDRRISLHASNRLVDQLLSDDILTLIVDHQHILFKNKLSTLKRVYSLERNEEKKSKILNDWIYIASSYCYILFENDLDCCDDLAIEIFTAYYLIAKLVFMNIKSSPVDFNLMNSKDRTNMTILLNKYDDLMSTHRHDYFKKICEKVDLLVPPSDYLTTKTHQSEKSLDLNTLRKSINSPAEFYPQSKHDDEDVDGDGDDDILSTTSSTYNSSDSSANETKSSFPTSIMRSISAESLFSMDPQNVVLLNVQTRNIHSSSRRIFTIDPKSIIDPQYFSTSIIPYLNTDDTIIFFTRSETITGIERYLYNVLTMNNFQNIFWLKGGYHAFKSEFLKNKTAKEIRSPQQLSNRSPPPPIPQTKPILTTTPNMSDTLNRNSPFQPSPSPNDQSLNKSLYPATPNNDINKTTTITTNKNPNQRYSHSYSSLADSKSSVSNESLPQHPIYPSNDNSFRKLTYLNKSVQNLSNENIYNSIQNKNQTLNSAIQSKTLLPSSLPPIPPVPKTKPIVSSTNAPPIPNIPLPKEYLPSPPKLYKLSRLDYKPTISLRNLGSTCYINSLIQCLFSLSKFRHFFINDEKLKSYLHDLNSRNLKLTSGFHDLFSTFYDKSPHNALPPVIDMTKFLSIIARLNPSYNIPNEQQDTSQFFYYIIDELHKELKYNYSTTMKLGLVSLNNDNDEKFHDWQLKLLQNEGYSFIQNLFNIKEAVVMKCNRCGYTSTRYDTSIMIHLSLKSTSCTLNEILMQNYKPEEMSTSLGNAWDCDGCTKAEKELEELQEKIEREHDINMASSKEKLKEKEHDKDNSKEKDKSKKNKDKDKQKESILSKTLFRRHNNKTKNKESKDSKDSDIEKFDATPEPNDFISNVLTESERKEYNRLADIFTRERIAYRSVEFIELPDVLVLCLSLFNPNQQDAKVIMKNLKFPETLNMQFEKCSRVYKLNSWIDHLGSSIDSGHYTATVPFQQSSYIVCDDDKLTPAQNIANNTVSDNDVYLLFYEAI